MEKKEEILENLNDALRIFQKNAQEFFLENLVSGYKMEIQESCILFRYHKYPHTLEFNVFWKDFFISDKREICFSIDTSTPGKAIGTMFPFEKMDETFFNYVNKIIEISMECIKDSSRRKEISSLKSTQFFETLNEFRAFLKEKRI